MKTSQVIELKAKELISVKQENCGYTIVGPATVIVLKEVDTSALNHEQRTTGEAAADTTAPEEQYDVGELVKRVAELPNDGKLKIFI